MEKYNKIFFYGFVHQVLPGHVLLIILNKSKIGLFGMAGKDAGIIHITYVLVIRRIRFLIKILHHIIDEESKESDKGQSQCDQIESLPPDHLKKLMPGNYDGFFHDSSRATLINIS